MTKVAKTQNIEETGLSPRPLPEQPFDGSDESFRLLVDHVPGVLYLCRNDNLFSMLYLSHAVDALVGGYPAADFLEGKISFVDLYHPDDTPGIFSEVEETLKQKRKFHLIYRLKHRDGHWKWIEEFGVGIERNGEIHFLEGYLRDITQRIEAESALKASEVRWRMLVENAPNHVAIVDKEGNYLYVNRVDEGFERDDVLKSDIFKWVPKEQHKVIRQNIHRAIVTGKPVKYEIEVVTPGSGTTWWSSCMGLIDSASESPHIMIISTDITREKKSKEDLAKAHAKLEQRVQERTLQLTKMNHRLEEEIVEREKAQQEMAKAKELAESASRSKGDFIASMSHELRTPLTSILGFVGLLEGERHGDLSESQIEFVTTIRRNAEHLLSLINDILDVAKTEAGQSQLHESVVNLDDLVRQCLEMISSRALENHLEIAPSPTSLGEAVVDERKIRQIVLNLLANACKFTPEGGRIGIRGVREESRFVITVWDTGIGIATPHQKSIFDQFRQLDSGDSRKYPGTGLGLTLAKKFVEMHGGDVWVDSTPGKGSQFSFSIPIIENS